MNPKHTAYATETKKIEVVYQQLQRLDVCNYVHHAFQI